MMLVRSPLPASLLVELRHPHRVDEDQAAEFLRLGPDRMKCRIGELAALDVAADGDPAQSERLDALFELPDGEIRVLQRDRREGDETIGLGGAQLRELFVLHLDDGLCDVALRLVPVGIDAERLDVDALLVHGADAIGAHDQIVRIDLHPHQRHGLRKRAVGMHVDRLHAAAVHHDLPAPRGCALRMDMRGGEQIAADEGGAGHDAGGAADEVSARGHVVLPVAGEPAGLPG